MIQDPISDLLTRLRNAVIVKSEFTIVSISKLSLAILELLKKEHFIKNFKVIKLNKRAYILVLLFSKITSSTLGFRNIKRISKSSLKIFITKFQKFSKISTKASLFSFFIISTSYGLMTCRTAKTLQIGGEILFQIELFY